MPLTQTQTNKTHHQLHNSRLCHPVRTRLSLHSSRSTGDHPHSTRIGRGGLAQLHGKGRESRVYERRRAEKLTSFRAASLEHTREAARAAGGRGPTVAAAAQQDHLL